MTPPYGLFARLSRLLNPQNPEKEKQEQRRLLEEHLRLRNSLQQLTEQIKRNKDPHYD